MLRSKRDRVKLNNRGFSLVELIVGIAILVIVSGAALGFMMTSTKTYKNVSDDVDLQEEAQIVMNQLETMVQNAGKGVNFMYKGKTITENPADSVEVEGFSFSASDIDTSAVDVDYKILYVYNQENRYVITFDVKNNKLMYREEARLKDESGTKFVNSFEDKSGSDALMCEYLEDFDVTLTSNDSKVVLNISLTMEKGVKTHKTNQNFFLRNSILLNTNVASIYPDTPEIETTYTDMVVKMGGRSFKPNTTNSFDIVIEGSDYAIPFYVTIEGNGYPSQEYVAELKVTNGDPNKEYIKDNNTLCVSKDVTTNTCTLICTAKAKPELKVSIAINIYVYGDCMIRMGNDALQENFYTKNEMDLQSEESLVAYLAGMDGYTSINGTPIAYEWKAVENCQIHNGKLKITGGPGSEFSLKAIARIGNIKRESVVFRYNVVDYNLFIYNGSALLGRYYVPFKVTSSQQFLGESEKYKYSVQHVNASQHPNENDDGYPNTDYYCLDVVYEETVKYEGVFTWHYITYQYTIRYTKTDLRENGSLNGQWEYWKTDSRKIDDWYTWK